MIGDDTHTLHPLQTAINGLDQSRNVPWFALECIRESSGEGPKVHPCDLRRPIEERQADARFTGIDWSSVPVGEDLFNPCEKPDAKSVRCEAFLSWIRNRPESHIAVVAHSNILTHLTTNFLPETTGQGPHGGEGDFAFANAELKRVAL